MGFCHSETFPLHRVAESVDIQNLTFCHSEAYNGAFLENWVYSESKEIGLKSSLRRHEKQMLNQVQHDMIDSASSAE